MRCRRARRARSAELEKPQLTPQRRRVLGDAYVDAQLSRGSNEFMQPAQDYVTRCAWDGLWSRPGLELKHRSLVVIT